MLMWLFPAIGVFAIVSAVVVNDALENLLRMARVPCSRAQNVASAQALMLFVGLLGSGAAAGLKSVTLAAASLGVLGLSSLSMGMLLVYAVSRAQVRDRAEKATVLHH